MHQETTSPTTESEQTITQMSTDQLEKIYEQIEDCTDPVQLRGLQQEANSAIAQLNIYIREYVRQITALARINT